ncbi:hypothetical protein [Dysgonomonas sp. 25]|uniref:hypothetical protein n=1 Tax=Dysgonomonas sp. 25 TaxID=2302933 RepID=UPI0013D74645|nr:hypothetical protein [Dysgonomonas sp. 25]NDV70398.1 hypothetical protein [Dysgonomonas sp. 25]
MSNRFIIQLIVVISSVFLGMFIYPRLKRLFICFIEKLYLQTRDDKPIEDESTVLQVEKIPSIIGKSKWIPGQRRTKTATDSENEKEKENAPIFAPDSQEGDPKMEDIEVPLEKIETLSEDEFDEESEQEELEIERGALQASGASYDELMKTGKILQKEKPSDEEKDTAGEVLYQQQFTDVVEQISSKDEATLTKVNEMIHFHMKKHNLNADDFEIGSDDDLKNFDANSIF